MLNQPRKLRNKSPSQIYFRELRTDNNAAVNSPPAKQLLRKRIIING